MTSSKVLYIVETVGIFALGTSISMGAGFALQEQSVAGLGTAFAGGAAFVDDNSSMSYNPASLTYHDEMQVTNGIHFILPEAEFRNEGTVSAYVPGVSAGVPTQGSSATSDEPAIVPNLYFSYPFNDRLVGGLGVSVPFGLASEYDEGWVGRYVALKSELETVNFNFALGYKVSDNLSIGGGLSILRGEAVLSNAINYGLLFLNQFSSGLIPQNAQTLALAQDIQANLGGTKYDGEINLEGNDLGWGFNIGLLYELNEKTRIGFQYRSEVDLKLSGRADFTVGALDSIYGGLFTDQGGEVKLVLPAIANISVHHQVNSDWAVMADILYTGWSSFDQLKIEYEDGLLPDSVIPEGWKDVYRFSVGTTYQMREDIVLRAGVSKDNSPVPNNQLRSPRIPDEDRVWLSIGLGYAYSDALTLDIGYTHIIVDDPVIDNPTHTTGEYLKGTIDATVNIISIGGTYRF